MLLCIKYKFHLLIPLCLSHALLFTNPGRPAKPIPIKPIPQEPTQKEKQQAALTESLKAFSPDNLRQLVESFTTDLRDNALLPTVRAAGNNLPEQFRDKAAFPVMACAAALKYDTTKEFSDKGNIIAIVVGTASFSACLYRYYCEYVEEQEEQKRMQANRFRGKRRTY